MKNVKWVVAIVCILIMSSTCHADEWAVTYGGRYSDGAHSVQQTTDGGYVVAGHTFSFGAGEADCWVLKLDAIGDITWQKTYGGSSYDYARSVQQTTDGGYLVAGLTASFGAGKYDYWVLKLDAIGDIIWQKTYGGSYSDGACSILQVADGGYVVAGSSAFGMDYDFWLLKLDGNGDVIWQKAYGENNYDEEPHSMRQTTDGGFVIAGEKRSIPLAISDGWVLRLNGSGDIIWQKAYGGSSYDYADSVQQTTDEGFVVAGYTKSFGMGGGDFWVMKLDSSGDVVWQKTYGGNAEDAAGSIHQTDDGSYIVSGSTKSFGAGFEDSCVLKLDGSGDIIWQKTYGGYWADHAGSIQQISDGGYVLWGETGYDLWLLKLDSNGDIPDCSIVGASDATAADLSTTVNDSTATPLDTLANPADTTISPQDSYAGRTWACGDGPLSIKKILPDHGAYGTKIKVEGGQWGEQRTGMFDQQEGYYSFVTFSDTQALIATKYLVWADNNVKVKFKKLFIDTDGDFLQDGNEPIFPADQVTLGDYVLKINTLRFEDLNANKIYDDGDIITGVDSSNPLLFTLDDTPIAYALIPGTTPASSPGDGRKVVITGLNFGNSQGASVLHIGGKSWSEGHSEIKIWKDDKIKFKIPPFTAPFPKYKKIWITVNGQDSNKLPLTITAP